MDDSDQDFVDLCSKLLKRVRKKPGEPRQAGHKSSSQKSSGDKRRRNNKKDGDCGTKPAGSQPVCSGDNTGQDSGDVGSSSLSAAAEQKSEKGLAAKDKVLIRMQQFKRASPQRMVHSDTNHEQDPVPPVPLTQRQDPLASLTSDLQPEQDSDEALALRLQQQLDQEAAEARAVDLEAGGLFFCQICQRDLSHMTPEGRTAHLNRCLDESEGVAPAPPLLPPPPPPPPPPPGVPDCPICGKKFKSQKSRSTHLKRCSSDMGVSPAVLLQAVQRQTEESQSVPAANTITQTGGAKRKGSSKSDLPARKKQRKKTEPLDDDTMVALALSSSLLDQERGQHRDLESERLLQTETAAAHAPVIPGLKWRPDAGKGRGKRKKAPRPPPLLLVQDAAAALSRLQERVSALLLHGRAPSPPTPTRCPSKLPRQDGAAPLWRRSTLLDGSSTSLSDFYTPELREFITPWESTEAASSSTTNKLQPSLQTSGERNPVTGPGVSIPSPSGNNTAVSSPTHSTPGTVQLPVGTQALHDLMELAEDGMTLTQCCYTPSSSDKDRAAGLHLSGFVPEDSDEQVDLCVSGFLPETTHTHSDNTRSRRRRTDDEPDNGRANYRPVALSRLASDLSSMVNNPQLSDLQLQVDSGDVYFAHSFMVYARCPLLAEMVHESGFGVQEDGMPATRRVLMNDVPGEAVFALLQYLYTAHCSIPPSLHPHVQELASRFDLQELLRLSELQQKDGATWVNEEDDVVQEENVDNQTDQAFVELLRSMWNDETGDNEGTDTDGREEEDGGPEEECRVEGLASVGGEIYEEKVNEEELEEIYEFAATQRKREEEKDSVEEEEEEEEKGEEEVFAKVTEEKRSSTDFSEPDLSLDRSYNRLFSESWGVYEEGDGSSLPSTSYAAQSRSSSSHHHQSLKKPSSELAGRTLLQSSASHIEDLSHCIPPDTSNLPVPGQSPGPTSGEGLPLKRESQGPRSICVPLSPASPETKKEPELIVLSDSSEEMDVVLVSTGPSPGTVQNSQCSLSQIKPHEPTTEDKELSPQSHPDTDCSPEVSWLIPSTPLQRVPSTRTGSTQTKSSMCRTQLFPKVEASSSSVFSSPALPSFNRHQTTKSPPIFSEDGPPRFDPDEMVPGSSSVSPKRTSICDSSKDKERFAVPVPKLSDASNSISFQQDTPLHLRPQQEPYSSTPLHVQLQQPLVVLPTSPLHSKSSTRHDSDGATSESPEKMEAESFHLSPLSNPSDPPSSTSQSHAQISQRQSDCSLQSQGQVESSSHDEMGSEVKRQRIENKDREGEEESGNNSICEQEGEKSETGEREVAEFSFQQSFMDMDEPPIAFNDSWGLGGCVEADPGRFSLRLEDSRGSSTDRQPSPPSSSVVQVESRTAVATFSPPKADSTRPSTTEGPSPPQPEINHSLPDSKIWDSWGEGEQEEEEEEEEVALPLSQRLNASLQHKTPVSRNKRRRTLVPITPMANYSDMDTPELKNKLNRFGVRPLPKRQMILKLKEIHQYTHQLASSDSEDEAPTAQVEPLRPGSEETHNGVRLQTVRFKEPRAPPITSPLKRHREEEEEEEEEPLSASQGSNTSSTAASEESERSNPELCLSSGGDSDSDDGISASQVASRLQDRLRAVQSFILSDADLYAQVLEYQPLVLSQLQGRLKSAGIRLGATKLADYLDSQCITFTTAKPGQSAPSRRRVKKTVKGAKAMGRKKVSAMI